MLQRKEDTGLLNKLIEENSSGTESGKEVAAYEKILDASSQWELQYPLSSSESFDQLIDKIDLEKDTKSSSNNYWFAIAVAVSILAVSSLVFLNVFSDVKVKSGVAEMKAIYLPDSSKVILNANSFLSYNASDWQQEKRSLHLSGHAYFEVKKGSKFTIQSDQGIVSVLGTSFDIFDRNGIYEVECFTGKVKVASQNSSVFLTKGLKTTLNSKLLQLEKPTLFDLKKEIEWTSGIFNFYDSPVRLVFEEIERQYDVKVMVEEELNRQYTGTFDTRNLNQALKNICKPLGLKFQFEEKNTIKIYNKKVN